MLSILTYHSLDTSGSVVSVTPQDFSHQMKCVADAGFQGVSLAEAVSYREMNGCWPDHSVALTFDDGFANFHESAWPTLERHGFTATVFVISGHMGGRNDWAPPPAGLGTRKILSWEQASELAARGVEIGSHTHTHPDLRRCSAAEVERELTKSRTEIEDRLGINVSSFAYPYGATTELSRRLAARQFRAACTTVLRQSNGESLHNLPRIDMYYIRPLRNLQRLLRGELNTYLAIRRVGRSARSVLMQNL
jgi:peptidoglycan/xylan/chitin deacetylase (PgdA/CDA1 family)